MKAKNLLSIGTFLSRFIMLSAILFMLTIALTQNLSAQNSIGVATIGSTGYPQTTVGNLSGGTGNDGGNSCVANYITTTVPLTAIAIKTYGTVSGNVKFAIYNDNAGSPGTKLYGEQEFSVVASTTTTSTITNTYLPAGTYWLVYNMNSSSANANFITKNTVTNYTRKYITQNYTTAFPGTNATWGSLANTFQDNIALVGVPIQGYAKATKATLSANETFSSMSFYSHAAGNARLAIYSDNGSGTAPLAKQWESGDVAVGATTWTNVNISNGTPTSLNLNAGTYWLAWQWNNAANGPSYSAGAANTGNEIVQVYGTYPASWTGGTASTENWSIYATYSTCNPPAAPTVSTPVNYCLNATASPLTATGTGLLWYTAATGGLGSSTAPTPLTTTLGTTPYYVSQTVGCEGSRAEIDVTVNALPTAPTTSGTTFCTGTSATLSASGATSGQVYKWYNASSGGTLLKTSTSNTDNTYTTGTLSATTNYWVTIVNTTGCESNRTIVTATLSNMSVSINTHKDISCFAGSDGEISILATGGTGPYSYSVDNGAHYTSSVNNPYTYGGLVAGTSYKIRVKDSHNCESPIIP